MPVTRTRPSTPENNPKGMRLCKVYEDSAVGVYRLRDGREVRVVWLKANHTRVNVVVWFGDYVRIEPWILRVHAAALSERILSEMEGT